MLMFYFSYIISAFALLFFQISSLLIRIATIVLFYDIYIQSIGPGMDIFSGLFRKK
jgi:hypothetical protein